MGNLEGQNEQFKVLSALRVSRSGALWTALVTTGGPGSGPLNVMESLSWRRDTDSQSPVTVDTQGIKAISDDMEMRLVTQVLTRIS